MFLNIIQLVNYKFIKLNKNKIILKTNEIDQNEIYKK